METLRNRKDQYVKAEVPYAVDLGEFEIVGIPGPYGEPVPDDSQILLLQLNYEVKGKPHFFELLVSREEVARAIFSKKWGSPEYE